MTAKENSLFKIGEVPFPRRLETEHLLIAGSTGTGKSQLIFGMLDEVRKVGERVVCFDIGSELLGRYYRNGVDHLLNPHDARTVPWSPLAEMRYDADAERIALSLIPSAAGSSEEWNGYVRKLFAAVLLKLWESGVGTNAEIVRLLTRSPVSELKAYVAGLPAEGLFMDGSERMLSSIMGIISTYIAPFQYLDPDAGEGAFSVRNWVEKEPGGDESWLFLSVSDSQLASLRPLIAAMLDTAISQALELPKNTDRVRAGKQVYALWVVLDEVASLRIPLDSLVSAAEKIRKVGGRLVCG